MLNALSFGWSALTLSRVVAPQGSSEATVDAGDGAGDDGVETPTGAEEKFLASAAAGFRTILADRRLGLVIGLWCAQTLVAGASTVFLAVEVLGLGDSGVGYFNSTRGIGSFIGGLVAIARSSRGSVGLDYRVGVLLWTVPPLLIAVWPSVPATFIAFALIGFANPLVDVNLMTLIQRITPEHLLGRVFGALESALIAAMALGAFLMPVLLRLGTSWGLVVISAPVALLAVLGIRGLLRIDRTVGEPEHLDLIRGLPLFQPLAPAEATRDDTLLSTMGAGDCFGEIALLRKVPRTATVTATAPSVLYTLAPEPFLAAVGAEPEAGNRADVLVTVRLAR